MTWHNKVTWSEGLFLRPQLFQQQERYLESYAHKRAEPLSPFFWGFSHFRIDHESLTLGKLVLASATGVYPDGTPFDLPGQTPPPSPLTLLPEHLGQIIYLALPIRTPNGEETTFEASPGSLARYNVIDAELRDSNSIGQGAKTVQLSQLRLQIVAEKELTSAWMGLPLAKLTALRSDGSAELDSTLIPPVNRYGASELLTQWLTQLHGTTRQRADNLAQRLSGSAGTGATQAAEVSDFLLLQILNRYEPLLDHLLRVRETSPEHAYTLLRGMAGEISTFIRIQTRRPNPLPPYEHRDPYTSFKALVEDTRELLNNLLVRSAQNIPLQEKQHGMYLASLDPVQLRSFSSLVLVVSANMPGEQLAQNFVAHTKVAPADRLPELVRLHLPSLVLRVLPVPPRQIPFNAGYVYFQIEPQGALWEHMLTHGGVGLHIATQLPGLRMELWGVR
ncbi:type VI secretion system baseplate subunit TssK [Curvibacter sp. CHRR-16]|uniref:type VI secretion system baseplate subunit TssK n=1 Tax=Curvibacter sp. CHRR-16 TaxID=2835872 RepID=UPI001BD94E3F|nr:type VI secretion system baseplate subunit TssK [Curvibacter sp. CHRR-16]MBT0571815.1 type VI secretion system baseplate subunit TssK [Curvibacter sp. CHRR-16]